MTDWSALHWLTVRPIRNPPATGGRHAQFRASFPQTLRLLRSELKHLDAQRVVLEADLRERDLRLDGLPRADARLASPAIALSFESPHGPLRYATGEYRDWTDNLRAIALSLEALRAVDRYGVSKRGEQYKGWAQLPQSTDPADQIVTEEQAWRVIAQAAGFPPDSSPLLNGISEDLAVRQALRKTHPDTGGTDLAFRQVMRAKEVLGL